jgi:hypothetical protein
MPLGLPSGASAGVAHELWSVIEPTPFIKASRLRL